MNRRNFLSSSIMSAGVLSLVPSSIFANNQVIISLHSFGKGFNRLTNRIKSISIELLSPGLIKAHHQLIVSLEKQGYTFNRKEVIKLSDACCAIPLYKKPLVGFDTKELALILKEDGTYKPYVLDEKTAMEFSALLENFGKSSDNLDLNLNTLDFAIPTKVLKHTKGKESLFRYKNALKNTITLKSSSKRSLAIIG